MPLEDSIKSKIALFCNVRKECVIENLTVSNLYEAPLMLEKQNFSNIVLNKLKLATPEPDMTEWNEMLARIASRKEKVVIGLVGKYVKLHDAYLSVAESLRHAGYENGCKVDIRWIDSEELTDENVAEILGECDGIIVPGGFGGRGIEGMVSAARYARENNVPYFGICLGMQIAVIEYARHILGLKNANSSEFDKDCPCVIDLMPDQHGNIPMGGTMRLGSYPCRVKEGTLLEKCYGANEVQERHRHRYEFNNNYRQTFEQSGMVFGGLSPDGRLVEEVELPQNDFYLGVQSHPEFKSRPNKAHPIFREFIAAAKRRHTAEKQ